MHAIVFEDRVVPRLWPLTTLRPACDLLVGGTTLVEMLGSFGPVHRAPRPHLAGYLEATAGRRVALWGGPTSVPPAGPPASTHGSLLLVVNARVVPSRDTLVALRSLVEAGRRVVVHGSGAEADTVAAAVLHLAADGGGPDRAVVAALRDGGTAVADAVAALPLPRADAALGIVSQPHEVVTAHEQALAGMLAVRIDSGTFHEVRPGLFVAEGAEIVEPIVVRGGGPVVVAAGATLGPFVCLDGPVWVGPHARVHPHAWIRAGTAIGDHCRVGGEIEATVMEPFSNKPHAGFVGHSHVGSWVNLAAGTTTGNLKATYGPVRLHEIDAAGRPSVVHTGRQFLGAMVGDCSRTTVNTALACGGRIGVAATVGGAVPERVDAFTTTLVAGGERTTPDQAATVLERMMVRRGLECLAADRALLHEAAALPAV